jgi:hypothetical protein
MSTQDPGEAGARPATPAWRPSGAAIGGEAASLPTPVRVEGSELYEESDSRLDESDEEFEQFDWDSWQPGVVSDDDGPLADEVDWDAVSAPDEPVDPFAIAEPLDPLSWREKVIGQSDWARGVTVGERETAVDPGAIQLAASASEDFTAEDDDLDPVPTSLTEPLLASGGAWPPASAVSHDVVHVRVAPWAPFTTGLALAVAMVLVSAAILSQTGRLGLTLAVLTGQVPTSADAVVNAYLSAVAHGDASKATSYLSTKPVNSLLLTDAVLGQSNKQGPLTILTVKAGSSDISGTQNVAATYKIGDEQVSTSFTTAFTEGQWVIRDDPGRIGVGSLRAAGIPLYINGQLVPDTIDSLPAFPGTYELSTNNAYIDYASPSTLVVRSSDEAPIIGAVKLQLTDAGRTAALASVRTAVNACLAKKELQPGGCPQNIEPNPNEPVVKDSIVYTATKESLTISDSDLRLSTVNVAYVSAWLLNVKVEVGGTPRDVSFTFNVRALWQVTLSGDHPSAVLQS